MDQRLKESISALMDDEANELELRRVLSHTEQDELKETWENYHHVKDVIQGENSFAINVDISSAVASAIREDAPVDDAVIGSKSVDEAKVAEVPSKKSSGATAWLAMAASVAFAVFFVFQGNDATRTTQSTPLTASTQSVEQAEGSLVKVAQTQQPKVLLELDADQAKQFSQYLLRHAEHSVRGTQAGFMPLARVASVNSVGI